MYPPFGSFVYKYIVEWMVNHFAISSENRREGSRFHHASRRRKAVAYRMQQQWTGNYPFDVCFFYFLASESDVSGVIFVVFLGG